MGLMNDKTLSQIGNLVARTSASLTFKLEGPGISDEDAGSVRLDVNGELGLTTYLVTFTREGRTLIEVYIRNAPFGAKGQLVTISHPSGGGSVKDFRLEAKVYEVALNLTAGVEDIIASEGK